jgi:Protein of unknown function (DUF2975)
MKQRFTFIKTVDLILKVFWSIQWVILLGIFIYAFLFISDSNLVDTSKLSGFQVYFSKINIGDVKIQEENLHNVYIKHGNGRLYISNYKQIIVYFRLIGAIIYTALAMVVIYSLRKMFANLKSGNFFVADNGKIIKNIGIIILGTSLFFSIYEFFVSSYIVNSLQVENIIFKKQIDFNYEILILGFILLIIAQVFIKGTEIKEEIDLTI